MTAEKLRNFCFTSFEKQKPLFNEDYMSYMIFGKEICPRTGLPHWQGYCELRDQERFNTVKKLMGNTVHIEARRGTGGEAADYCKKDGDYEEYGTMKMQGERTDLKAVARAIAGGASRLDVAIQRPAEFIKFHRGIEKMINMRDKAYRKGEREVKVRVLIGPPGIGKTRSIYDKYPDCYRFCCMEKTQIWFDGYEGEKVLLIDDMDKDCIPYGMMLAICDRYPLRLPIKGDFVYAAWERVYITSNKRVERWWNGANCDAFNRRAKVISFFETADPHEQEESDTSKSVAAQPPDSTLKDVSEVGGNTNPHPDYSKLVKTRKSRKS